MTNELFAGLIHNFLACAHMIEASGIRKSVYVVIIMLLAVVAVSFFFRAQNNITSNVIDEKTIAGNLAQVCEKENSDFCYGREFRELARTHDMQWTRRVLAALQTEDPRTLHCHVIAHYIGATEVEKDPMQWQSLLASIDPQACLGGFFHGIFEARMRLDPTFEIAGNQIPSICGNLTSTYSLGSCAHALGHLILVEAGGDVTKAVENCRGATSEFSAMCFGGVFMEYTVKGNLQAHDLGKQVSWDINLAQETEKLCRSYAGEPAMACWGELGHVYAAINDDKAPMAFSLCEEAPSLEARKNCYMMAIEKIAVTAKNDDQLVGLCDPYSKTDSGIFQECIQRVVTTLLKSSVEYAKRAENFCANLKSFNRTCFDAIAQELTTDQ